MKKERVTIADIAEELGLSTATVSNVIHGKTKKVSDETVKRVQELLEKRAYIPSMAGILLAQNDSGILGIVVNDHEKYEGHVLEDGFISASLNALSQQIGQTGYFMLVKVTKQWDDIVRFASMWNMEGLILIGFCEQDYKRLRESMRIPFVVYDGFFQQSQGICNLTIDDFDGGYQVGSYLKQMGHTRVLCLSDNFLCVDSARTEGCIAALGREAVGLLQLPYHKEERLDFYAAHLSEILTYSAVFAASDFYAVELILFLQAHGTQVPRDISVVGFDDSPLCRYCTPGLTTVRQDASVRAETAISLLQDLKNGTQEGTTIRLPVSLVVRESVREHPEK